MIQERCKQLGIKIIDMTLNENEVWTETKKNSNQRNNLEQTAKEIINNYNENSEIFGYIKNLFKDSNKKNPFGNLY